jgi:hypothetical protein
VEPSSSHSCASSPEAVPAILTPRLTVRVRHPVVGCPRLAALFARQEDSAAADERRKTSRGEMRAVACMNETGARRWARGRGLCGRPRAGVLYFWLLASFVCHVDLFESASQPNLSSSPLLSKGCRTLPEVSLLLRYGHECQTNAARLPTLTDVRVDPMRCGVGRVV